MSAAPRTQRRRRPGSARHRWLRRIALAGVASGFLGVVGLAAPMVAHGQAANLLAYGATGTGWAIQPYVLNDEFINIPAADQSAPYVYVAIDNNPSADAKAAYFTPGTAVNAGLSQQSATSYQVPSGVEARYPGAGTANGSVGTVSDGVATQAGAGTQQAQAAEAYAQAQAALASYQFAPPPGLIPSGPPTVPTLPSVPGVPTLPPVPTLPAIGATPTATSSGGGGGGGGNPTATATPTPTQGLCLPILCPPTPTKAAQQASAASQAGYLAESARTASTPPVQLPDALELNLANALKAAALSNPDLLKLAGGALPAPNPALPYAGADASSQAVTKADDGGTQITIVTHLAHVQLFQGLVTFAAIDSTLQATAPASNAQGTGKITTTITGAAIGGIPVTFDANGIQVAGQGGQTASALQTLTDTLNGALKTANIQIALFRGTSMSDVGKWQGSGGGLDVLGTFDPVPGKVPATHVDFSLARVTASLYAVPNISDLGGGGDNGGFFGGFFGGGGGCCDTGSSGSTTNNPAPRRGGLLTLPYTLTPGELLALLFIVQGFSTAAVAAAASNAETLARLSVQPPEEESR